MLSPRHILAIVLAAANPAIGVVARLDPASLNSRDANTEVQTVPCMGDNAFQISYFGERPSWSPDGKRLAFMAKSFGDAFEIDLMTNRMTLLTGYPHAGYLRAQYLPNGDLFLIGARDFKDATTTREEDEEMWILKPGSLEPIALNHKIWEGVAISRTAERIAWTNSYQQYPDQFEEGEYVIFVADIDYSSGTPELANKKEVTRSMESECPIEPQDFLKNDTELTYSCYVPSNTTDISYVYGVNIESGKKTTYRHVEGQYNEVEGIYPNEKYTLVESATSKKEDGHTSVQGIEIYRMSLEPNSTDWTRLTHFSDTKGWKAGNPVVSPDGRTMAVHSSRNEVAAGVGYGMYLVPLE